MAQFFRKGMEGYRILGTIWNWGQLTVKCLEFRVTTAPGRSQQITDKDIWGCQRKALCMCVCSLREETVTCACQGSKLRVTADEMIQFASADLTLTFLRNHQMFKGHSNIQLSPIDSLFEANYTQICWCTVHSCRVGREKRTVAVAVAARGFGISCPLIFKISPKIGGPCSTTRNLEHCCIWF